MDLYISVHDVWGVVKRRSGEKRGGSISRVVNRKSAQDAGGRKFAFLQAFAFFSFCTKTAQLHENILIK